MSGDSRQPIVTVSVKRSGAWRKQRLTLGDWYEVWRQPISIGRNPDCTIRIESSEVEPLHAIVTGKGHYIFVEVVEGTTSCVGRTESTRGTTWRVSRGIGDPEPIDVGPFQVVIRSRKKRWWRTGR